MAAPGHSTICMRAKMNRYDLSLWDVRKRSLYGRETESVQAATLAGGFMEGTWWTPPQPRRNKAWRSCPESKSFSGISPPVAYLSRLSVGDSINYTGGQPRETQRASARFGYPVFDKMQEGRQPYFSSSTSFSLPLLISSIFLISSSVSF